MKEKRRGFLLESERSERMGRERVGSRGEGTNGSRGGDGDEEGGGVGGGRRRGGGGGKVGEEFEGFDFVIDMNEGNDLSGEGIDGKNRGRGRGRGGRRGVGVGHGRLEGLVGGWTEGNEGREGHRGANIVRPEGRTRERGESEELSRGGGD